MGLRVLGLGLASNAFNPKELRIRVALALWYFGLLLLEIFICLDDAVEELAAWPSSRQKA